MTTLARLTEILAKDFDIPRAALLPEATLESLEIDSLRMIEILFVVEEAFGISVPADPAELRAKVKTLGDLGNYIDPLSPALSLKGGGERP